MKKLNFSFLIIILLLTSCRKDKDEFIPYDNPIPVPSYIIGSVGGVIADDNGNTLPNAEIKLTTKTSVVETVADVNGIFFFRNVEINAERTYLQIEAAGFLPSSRAFTPRASGTEFLNIRLMSSTSPVGSITSQGGLVDAMGGGSVDLPSNSVVDFEGNPAGDSVLVNARFLNPVLNITGARMPGNLSAVNKEGESKILATYGMMAFDLSSAAGDELIIATDQSATIQFPVSDELLEFAPTTIAMWYFDESMERWVEEGQAQLIDNYYEGTVSQTAFWNVAVAYNPVQLEGVITFGESTVKFENALTKIKVVDNGIAVITNSDDGGVLDGTIPASQILQLEIYDNCDQLIHTSEIEPFAADVDLGEILIDASNNNLVQISGQLECDGVVVTEGYAKIDFGETSNIYFADEAGQFKGNFISCFGDGFELTGFDIVNSKKSETIFYQTEQVVDVGSLSVCE